MTPEAASKEAEKICRLAPVVPVLVIHDASTAADLARALVAGGLPALEVTLRTPAALDAIREMAKVEGGVVGAGSILNPAAVTAVVEAGARFGVSPGSTDRVLSAAEDADLPMLPGAATSSEVMALLERGYRVQKFFPASINGGAPAIKAIGAPIPDVMFCPTGGVTPGNARDYLSLKNIICVGGSWVAPQELIEAKDWKGIEKLAAEAAALTA
ncbi:bifunctional 4-hydroxy-2-oxoglutarate aldolase/2-dehydro-3-deoxy-phosphogluconate aldolase [Pseudooceanicola sp. HF7]|uniref:bifunctional 4-hydroxy-2-oxoglutarate aldolase/2-dehydro-3-deoxy-phosphogluconate aldolase n=1 Tax=Pseudooceanicola sp. HF7 TaxID=2721560 RepID=UPI00143129CD|nr:bifunctional 4-hydroxy-2-oxoglutarate aldolase/2-dehydro-3-deoxy-phosphogluconate aldolase [Pseudooceanicola sp. HF7]NIZ08770.1 bifunctional 4-hydroxy-2-oxoglutarate aldolase/2-dehydro-3-deoxy-phosphogluconate aldolase [Pseudooceanicola sp. HF7]